MRKTRIFSSKIAVLAIESYLWSHFHKSLEDSDSSPHQGTKNGLKMAEHVVNRFHASDFYESKQAVYIFRRNACRIAIEGVLLKNLS